MPLLETHTDMREMISLNAVTDSCKERIRRKLPGCELMFKAEGQLAEQTLQLYIVSKTDLPFNVSVVTGVSGSY